MLAQAASLVRIERQREPNTLFLVGTYSIGKERVLEAVAKAAGSRYVRPFIIYPRQSVDAPQLVLFFETVFQTVRL